MDAMPMSGWSVNNRPPTIFAEGLAEVFALLQSQQNNNKAMRCLCRAGIKKKE